MKTETREEVQGMTAATVMQHITSPAMQQLVHKIVADTLDELARASALSGNGILSWEMSQAQVGEIALDCLQKVGETLDLHNGKVGEALHAKTQVINGQGLVVPRAL